jgi:hypothetical protein
MKREEDCQDPFHLHFRKLKNHKGDAVQKLKIELTNIVQCALGCTDCVRCVTYLHGRGQAIMEMSTAELARASLVALQDQGYTNVTLGTPRSKANVKSGSSSMNLAPPVLQNIRQECERALVATIRSVITQDGHERCVERRKRKRTHNKLIEQVSGSKADISAIIPDKTKYDAIYLLLGESDIGDSCGGGIDDNTGSNRIEPEVLATLDQTRIDELCDLVSSLHTPINRRLRKLICWKSVRRGRPCGGRKRNKTLEGDVESSSESDNEECALLHVSRPVTELPTTMRSFEIDDSFTDAAESADVKAQVNDFVAKKGIKSAERGYNRCLVLDGKRCNTSRAILKASPIGSRKPSDIIVPNYCSATSSHMQKEHSDVCSAYFGSVRAFLDHIHYTAASSYDDDKVLNISTNENKNRFGLVYLDYCCRFLCGYRSVELSPREDLNTLFSYGLLHSYAELIICVHKDREIQQESGCIETSSITTVTSSLVLDTIHSLANSYKYDIISCGTYFRYGELEVHSVSLQKCES